jgi:biopolymer transport protein ExbD
MTSLINVVLMLRIFFMMSTTFVDESRLSINLPEAAESASATVRDGVEIEFTAEGNYRVNGLALVNNSPDTLSVALSQAAEGNRAVPATIRADARPCTNPW